MKHGAIQRSRSSHWVQSSTTRALEYNATRRNILQHAATHKRRFEEFQQKAANLVQSSMTRPREYTTTRRNILRSILRHVAVYSRVLASCLDGSRLTVLNSTWCCASLPEQSITRKMSVCAYVCTCVWICACVCVSVCACMRVCVRETESACVLIWDGIGKTLFVHTSTGFVKVVYVCVCLCACVLVWVAVSGHVSYVVSWWHGLCILEKNVDKRLKRAIVIVARVTLYRVRPWWRVHLVCRVIKIIFHAHHPALHAFKDICGLWYDMHHASTRRCCARAPILIKTVTVHVVNKSQVCIHTRNSVRVEGEDNLVLFGAELSTDRLQFCIPYCQCHD